MKEVIEFRDKKYPIRELRVGWGEEEVVVIANKKLFEAIAEEEYSEEEVYVDSKINFYLTEEEMSLSDEDLINHLKRTRSI